MYGGPDGMAMPQQYAQGMMNPQMRYGGYGGPAGQVGNVINFSFLFYFLDVDFFFIFTI